MILRHFLRRDAARNSGGFSYLRALHGHRCLPRSPGLLAADDARTLVCEDLGPAPVAAGSPDSMTGWLRALLVLCLPAESPAGRRFREGITRADAAAEAHGGAGALASWRLLQADGVLSEADARVLIDPRTSVLWCGDLNPRNFLDVPGRGWTQVDLEGSCWSHPALLVAEVEAGLPLSAAAGPFPAPAEGWTAAAQALAEHWTVNDDTLELARAGLGSVVSELGGG